MNNNKSNFKALLKNTKFATFNPQTKDIILAEYIIASSILNGVSFSQLLAEADQIENEKDKNQATTKITNTVLDFINLNPEYAEILKQNNKAHEFLKSLN